MHLLVALTVALAAVPPSVSLRVNARHDDGSIRVLVLLEGEKQLGKETLDEEGNVEKVKGAFPDGVIPIVSDSGKERGSVSYKDNARNGEALTLFKSGKVKLRSRYVGGKKNGLEETFSSDGVLESTMTYKDGQLDGPAAGYFQSGKVMFKSEYAAGLQVGDEKTFDEGGKLVSVQQWDKGVPGAMRCFDGGKQVPCDDEAPAPTAKATPAVPKAVERGRLTLKSVMKGREAVGSIVYLDGKEIARERLLENEGIVEVESGTIPDGVADLLDERNRSFADVPYKNGRRNGTMKTYWYEEVLRTEFTYVDGKREGAGKLYREAGTLESKVTYKNGKLDGPWLDYSLTGVVFRETPFKNGVANGTVKLYYPNGKLAVRATAVDGETTDEQFFSDDGKPVTRAQYQALFKARWDAAEAALLGDDDVEADDRGGGSREPRSSGKLDGASCRFSSECASGVCRFSRCATAAGGKKQQAPGTKCRFSSDCASGRCLRDVCK